jgi:hypothetical protein
MQRVFPVPEDVPENYIPIIVCFAELDSKGSTGAYVHASVEILDSLRKKPIAQRMKIIKKICSFVEETLLQYSTNPEDVKLRII